MNDKLNFRAIQEGESSMGFHQVPIKRREAPLLCVCVMSGLTEMCERHTLHNEMVPVTTSVSLHATHTHRHLCPTFVCVFFVDLWACFVSANKQLAISCNPLLQTKENKKKSKCKTYHNFIKSQLSVSGVILLALCFPSRWLQCWEEDEEALLWGEWCYLPLAKLVLYKAEPRGAIRCSGFSRWQNRFRFVTERSQLSNSEKHYSWANVCMTLVST